MTNKARQNSLDVKKWNDSFKAGQDLSGQMSYCDHCEYKRIDKLTNAPACFAIHEKRVDKCLCAKAYNRMVRGTKK